MPLALPRMIEIEGKLVIAFSHFVFGETPSVCFYSVDEGREIMQCQGTSMLVHISDETNDETGVKEQDCVFYTNPIYC